MKLSDIKGERVFDVIAEVIEPITKIAEDEDAAKLFHRDVCPDDMAPWQFFVRKLRRHLPALVKGHKAELVHILSTIQGVADEEYVESMTLGSLIRDLTELVTDVEFVSFFE